MKHNKPQNKPVDGNKTVLPMVVADLTERALEGLKTYGKPLQTNNGRNALWDAYQEALDLCMYLRQKIEEESEHKQADDINILCFNIPKGLNAKLCKLSGVTDHQYQYWQALEVLKVRFGYHIFVSRCFVNVGLFKWAIMYDDSYSEGDVDILHEAEAYNVAISKVLNIIEQVNKMKHDRKDCNNGYGKSC